MIYRAAYSPLFRHPLFPLLPKVAVKVQFPGVAQSIDSDLSNLGRLLTLSNRARRPTFSPPLLLSDSQRAPNSTGELAWRGALRLCA